MSKEITVDVVAPEGEVTKEENHLPATASWQRAKRWLDAAEKFEKCRLASQVMLGMELLELHGRNRISAGNPQFFHDERIGWGELLRQHLDISETTAWRFMSMAKEGKKRIKQLPDAKHLESIIDLPISQQSPEQTEAITKVVQKLTDAYTQQEFMCELGLVKVPQGWGAKGGARERTTRPPGEAYAKSVELATSDWAELDKLLLYYNSKFTLLTDAQVESQLILLNRMYQVRKMWLDSQDRDESVIRDIEARIKALVPQEEITVRRQPGRRKSNDVN